MLEGGLIHARGDNDAAIAIGSDRYVRPSDQHGLLIDAEESADIDDQSLSAAVAAEHHFVDLADAVALGVLHGGTDQLAGLDADGSGRRRRLFGRTKRR